MPLLELLKSLELYRELLRRQETLARWCDESSVVDFGSLLTVANCCCCWYDGDGMTVDTGAGDETLGDKYGKDEEEGEEGLLLLLQEAARPPLEPLKMLGAEV